MRWFRRKQRTMTLLEHCHVHYEMLLGNVVDSGGASRVWSMGQALGEKLTSEDGAFASVAPQRRDRELVLLCIELHGLVLAQRLGFSQCLKELTFTEDFLRERGYAQMWEDLGAYNEAVGAAACAHREREGLRVADDFQRLYLQMVTETKSAVDRGYREAVAERAANRLGRDPKGFGVPVPLMLARTFCERTVGNADFGPGWRVMVIAEAIHATDTRMLTEFRIVEP